LTAIYQEGIRENLFAAWILEGVYQMLRAALPGRIIRLNLVNLDRRRVFRSDSGTVLEPDTFMEKSLIPLVRPLAGARITAVPDGRASGSSSTSNEAGRIQSALETGTYAVRIHSQWFSDALRKVSLEANGSEHLEIVLHSRRHSSIPWTVTDISNYQVPAITTANQNGNPCCVMSLHPISVVTKQQIRDQQMTSIADVIALRSRISVHQGENNRDQLIFRGNSSQCGLLPQRCPRRRSILS
jgi:hypothetical protein